MYYYNFIRDYDQRPIFHHYVNDLIGIAVMIRISKIHENTFIKVQYTYFIDILLYMLD